MKKITTIFLSVITIMLLASCGNSFNAKGYVNGVLDAETKGEFKEYVKYTNATKEECEELYSKNLDETMELFDEEGMSSDLQDKYRDLFMKMYKKTKYTVNEGKLNKDKEYEVTIDIEPLLIFETFDEDLEKYQGELMMELEESILNDGDIPTEEDILNQVFSRIYDILNEKADKPEYGKKRINNSCS